MTQIRRRVTEGSEGLSVNCPHACKGNLQTLLTLRNPVTKRPFTLTTTTTTGAHDEHVQDRQAHSETTEPQENDLPAGYDDPDGPRWVHPSIRPHFRADPLRDRYWLSDRVRLVEWARKKVVLARYVATGTKSVGLTVLAAAAPACVGLVFAWLLGVFNRRSKG